MNTQNVKKKGPKEIRFEKESKALKKNLLKRKKQIEELKKLNQTKNDE